MHLALTAIAGSAQRHWSPELNYISMKNTKTNNEKTTCVENDWEIQNEKPNTKIEENKINLFLV